MRYLYRVFWLLVLLGSAFSVGWWITGDVATAWQPAFALYFLSYANYELVLSQTI